MFGKPLFFPLSSMFLTGNFPGVCCCSLLNNSLLGSRCTCGRVVSVLERQEFVFTDVSLPSGVTLTLFNSTFLLVVRFSSTGGRSDLSLPLLKFTLDDLKVEAFGDLISRTSPREMPQKPASEEVLALVL